MKPGSGKRNPFKKANSSRVSNSPNPIKHLTDSIVGLPSNDSFGSSRALKEASEENGETTNGSEKVVPAKSPARKPFFEWFKEHKAALMEEMPEGSNPSELTSFAMKKYKQTTINGMEPSTSGTAKRKLDEKENEGGSGIAKLAKFRLEA